MYLRAITIKGVTRLYFYESYYDNGKTIQKCIENLGRLDKLAEVFPDPISHFKQVAQERSNEAKADSTTSIPIDLTSVMDQNEDNQKNVGYSVLKEPYKQLELDKFWKSIQKKTSIHYDLEAVFRLLVFSRILYPGSKMDTFNKKEIYFEKIAEDEKYDGYYSIVTSELKMTDYEIRDTYRGLSRIEETFKISKTEFESRPVFVWTNAHIEGHFATCFTALVLIRLLPAKLGSQYPVGKMIESLRKYNCTQIDTTLYQFLYYDKILEACGEVFHIEFKNRYRTRNQIRRMLKY